MPVGRLVEGSTRARLRTASGKLWWFQGCTIAEEGEDLFGPFGSETPDTVTIIFSIPDVFSWPGIPGCPSVEYRWKYPDNHMFLERYGCRCEWRGEEGVSCNPLQPRRRAWLQMGDASGDRHYLWLRIWSFLETDTRPCIGGPSPNTMAIIFYGTTAWVDAGNPFYGINFDNRVGWGGLDGDCSYGGTANFYPQVVPPP